ncbi:MAG: hypothetical protein LQ337_004654 [Flavoplaca oasis]|nr:MAG: hypothetical protein LQ337_004654 [Flavoplaca oasis]
MRGRRVKGLGEVDGEEGNNGLDVEGDVLREKEEEARLNLLAILNAIVESQYPHPTPLKHNAGKNENGNENVINRQRNNDLLIIGSLHDSLFPLLTAPTDRLEERRVLPRPSDNASHHNAKEGNDIIDPTGRGVLGSIGSPVMKYLIPPPPSPSPPTTINTKSSKHKPSSILPPGYTYSELQPQDLETCVQRTDIPRTVGTLSTLKSACVRYDGEGKGQELIAWVFISSDGSLSSLFVEPSHRGKGIARAVVRRLIMLSSEGVQEGEDKHNREERTGNGWVSSDVYLDNKGGRGVAMGVGGKEAWVCRWVGCDLERVTDVWLREEKES